MNTKGCGCGGKGRARDEALPPAGWLRRGGEIAGWGVPTVTLALLPKCPACVAGYVALATGLGISLPVAACLRCTLVALCVASLGFVGLKRLRGLLHRARRQSGE